MATMTESSYPGARMLLQPSSAVLQSLNLCSQYFSYPYAGVPCSCAQCQSTAKTPAPPTSSFSSPGYNYLRYHPHYSASGQGGFRTPQWSANPTDFNNGGYCTCCSRMQGGSIYQSQTSNLSLNPTAFTADSSSEYSEPVSAVSEPYSKMPMQYPPSVSECCSLSQSVSPPLSVSSSSTSSPLSHHSAVSPSQLSDAYDSSPEHADEGTPENCEWSFASASKNSVELKGPAYRSHFGNRQPRKDRLCFTPEQIQQLEVNFVQKKYLGQAARQELAERVRISEAQVKTWYQNRRTKWKRGQKVSA